MTFKPWVYLSSLLIIIILIVILQPDEIEEELPVIGQIPSFSGQFVNDGFGILSPSPEKVTETEQVSQLMVTSPLIC